MVNKNVWYLLGRSCYQKGIYEKAIENFQKAIKDNPKNIDAWADTAVAHERLGDYQKEIECCEKVIELNENDPDAWYNVGKTLMIHQLLCQAVLSNRNENLEAPVLYLDTEKQFSPELIQAIAARFNLDPKNVFRNIARLEINSAEELIQSVEKKLIQFIEKFRIRVILVDNIYQVFKTDYEGKNKLPDRQGNLARVL